MNPEIDFERLNTGWNADPNAPCLQIEVVDEDVIIQFYLNAFQHKRFSEGDRAKIVFRDCLQYRIGSPNDEGFYDYGQSRFKKFGVQWGEFYDVHHSGWEENFPDPIPVSEKRAERRHYLFYFKDETFECIASSYDLKFLMLR